MSSTNSINPATAKDLIMHIRKLRKDNYHFRIMTDDNIRKLNVSHLENTDAYSKLFLDQMHRKPKLNQKKLKGWIIMTVVHCGLSSCHIKI